MSKLLERKISRPTIWLFLVFILPIAILGSSKKQNSCKEVKEAKFQTFIGKQLRFKVGGESSRMWVTLTKDGEVHYESNNMFSLLKDDYGKFKIIDEQAIVITMPRDKAHQRFLDLQKMDREEKLNFGLDKHSDNYEKHPYYIIMIIWSPGKPKRLVLQGYYSPDGIAQAEEDYNISGVAECLFEPLRSP